MSPSLQHLYHTVNDDISRSCPYRDELVALATAKETLMDRLKELTNNESWALVDVYVTLDEQRQELHEQALFQAALSLGLQLGQLHAWDEELT